MMLIQIAGHLGADPEHRVTPTGQKVTTFRVAVNVRKGGTDKTLWWRVTIWGDRFDKMIEHLKKGSPVIASGRFSAPDIYTDRSGNQQVSLEITAEMLFFSPFGRSQQQQVSGEASAESGTAAFQGAQQEGVVPGAGQANFSDDDIPF